MTDEVECIVVGAGVVGLAIARRLAMAGREVVVLEAENAFGTHTSSRNSEVIHAGIYYPKGSLKARLCVSGKQVLYRYCAERGIGHARCGKLIVATEPDEVPVLATLEEKARGNGVDDLQYLTGAEAKSLEPALRAEAALLSPSTGIIDSHALMLNYLGDAEEHGAAIAYNTPFVQATADDRGFLFTAGTSDHAAVRCRVLINAAGHGAHAVARSIGGLDPATIPPRHLCKGTYFSASGAHRFRHLIYPVPASASLGIHLTVDLGGQVRFGPDQEWVNDIDYGLDESRAAAFYDTIRRYYPGLPGGSLQPTYAGVRPKIQGPTDPMTDFAIHDKRDHGIPGLVNLFGIESPGLTSSLALADDVFARLDGA